MFKKILTQKIEGEVCVNQVDCLSDLQYTNYM